MSDQPNRLRGRVALVTGAGRGIGQAIAAALADAGAAVALNDRELRDMDEAVASIGHDVLSVAADVADRHAVARMFDQVTRELGPVDILVNNAGVARPFGPVADVDPGEWWRAIETNLYGTFLCSHYALATMLPRKHGRIVNIASNNGLEPLPNLSAYAVSKAAIIRLTEQVAVETQGQGIVVFSINPGPIKTAMTEDAATSPDVATSAPNVASAFQRIFAAGRDMPSQLAAELVVRLAQGDADPLSGAFIDIRAGDDLDAMVAQTERIEQESLHRLRLRRYTEGVS